MHPLNRMHDEIKIYNQTIFLHLTVTSYQSNRISVKQICPKTVIKSITQDYISQNAPINFSKSLSHKKIKLSNYFQMHLFKSVRDSHV